MAFLEAHNAQEALDVAGKVCAGAAKAARMPAHAQAGVLEALAASIRSEREAWAKLLVEEVSKPLKDARREADRAAFTASWAAS